MTGNSGTNGGFEVAGVLDGQGVRCVFTLCGGHVSPILVGCRQAGIRVVDVRHEATAVFAADAVGRLTGRPGVAVVTAGPGVTNTVTAVKNAGLAGSPVVLLGGATATALKGRGALQDIDQRALMAPHVKWFGAARRVKDLGPLLRRAFREALSGVPGPVFLECPVDLLYPEQVVRDWYGTGSGKLERLVLKRHVNRLFAGAGGPSRSGPVEVPPPDAPAGAVRKTAQVLARSRKPVLLLGSQAVVEPGEAGELAEAVGSLGVPAFLSGTARGLLGRDHALQVRHKRKDALREADLILLAGLPSDFRLGYGRHYNRSATLVGVNRSRRELRRNRKPDLGVCCDAGRFLQALAGQAAGAGDRWNSWIGSLRDRDEAREREIVQQAETAVEHVNPLRLCREIESALPEDAVLVADGGDFVATASYIVRPRSPLSWLDPGVFGTLGVGAGFALGAAVCRPGSPVWLLYGDGSAGYSLAEFDTFVRHGMPVLAVVGNDASWAQIARDQVELLGDDVACKLLPTAYHQVAEGFGGAGLLVEDGGRVPDALRQAMEITAAGRPVLVNARIGSTGFRKGSISI